ncbi:YceI family protein [Flavobacterium sp. LS1R49]|uniref:YceI family protein n=1 Tax=Flavobacterium shii TaxID=2987687 RepID=A0A9X3C5R9_9FLAO|nr:YceI family protein [Flavobacterium shii]MCV9927882.1 YceI family protein [Flavobacterium shii]
MKSIKNSMLLLMLLSGIWAGAQKIATRTGNIKFEASVATYEEITSENKSVSAVLEQSTGDFAALALIKGFRFKVALMEEHFNENYMESETYPKATFKGKLDGFDINKITTTPKNYTLKGDLTVHGKTKAISVIAKVYKSSNGLVINGNFDVKPVDFAIEVPSLVSKKIADKIKINYNFLLVK